MVQFIQAQKKPNIGSALFSALSAGLNQYGKGFEENRNYELNRSRLQDAIGTLSKLDTSQMNPAQIATKWVEGLGNVPGGEQALSQILPHVLTQGRTNNVFGGQQAQTKETPQDQPISAMAMTSQGNMPQANSPLLPSLNVQSKNFQSNASQQVQPSSGLGGSGTLPSNVWTPEQVIQEAQKRTQATGDWSNYNSMLESVKEENDLRRKGASDPVLDQQRETLRQNDLLNRNQQLDTWATNKLQKDYGELKSEEVNDFMRMMDKYNYLGDPAKIYEATNRDFKKYINLRDNFDNAYVPGLFNGMLRGGKFREESLNKLTRLADPLVKMGKSDFVRDKLAQLDLTPTETGKVLNPMTEIAKKNLKNVPGSFFNPIEEERRNHPAAINTTKSYEEIKEKNPQVIQKLNNKLSNYIRDNLSNDISLLAMRDAVMNDKNYDYRQFEDALNTALDNGLELTPVQQGELSELTHPPRESLSNIFYSFGGVLDYLRGAK